MRLKELSIEAKQFRLESLLDTRQVNFRVFSSRMVSVDQKCGGRQEKKNQPVTYFGRVRGSRIRLFVHIRVDGNGQASRSQPKWDVSDSRNDMRRIGLMLTCEQNSLILTFRPLI